MEDESEVEGTVVVAALVLRLELEDWPDLKRLVESSGGRIIYQRIAPLGSKLYITDRDPREAGPAEVRP